MHVDTLIVVPDQALADRMRLLLKPKVEVTTPFRRHAGLRASVIILTFTPDSACGGDVVLRTQLMEAINELRSTLVPGGVMIDATMIGMCGHGERGRNATI